jgi:hypothetical protein
MKGGDEVKLSGVVRRVGKNPYDTEDEIAVQIHVFNHSLSLSPDYVEPQQQPPPPASGQTADPASATASSPAGSAGALLSPGRSRSRPGRSWRTSA